MPKLVDLKQNSPEWVKWRAMGIGGSDAAAIAHRSPWVSPDTLKEQKIKHLRIEENEAMARGHRLEPIARIKYMERTGKRVSPCCVVHPNLSWHRSSLDGLSEDGLWVIEIKSPMNDKLTGNPAKAHVAAIRDGKIPSYYIPQVQHQIITVSGFDLDHPKGIFPMPKVHFVSYSDSNEISSEDQLAIVTVEPDFDFMESLLIQETRFFRELEEEIEHGK